MTTPLDKPVAREVVLGDQAYKVVMSPDGVRVTRKGGRKGSELPWGSLLALGQGTAEPPDLKEAPARDVPRPIAADLAKELRTATDALARARSLLARVDSIPPALLMEANPDPIYGKRDEGTDWYIEPLLTPHEVGSILRVSKATVSHLGIRSLNVGGESRYRQSDVRRYLTAQENRY